jgi:hypothetical protein
MARPAQRTRKPPHVCQFLIVLPSTDPFVWRRIQVPERYSFSDLHVAIQDAMGWKDAHLHEFTIADPRTGHATSVGIPDEEVPEERPVLAGWEVPIAQYFAFRMGPVRYRYDFGDNWTHVLEFEDLAPADGGPYPRCLAGAGACPPEDVGGTHGYMEFLRAIGDSRHPAHDAMREWVGGTFDPHLFDPRSVRFGDPRERWKITFQE